MAELGKENQAANAVEKAPDVQQVVNTAVNKIEELASNLKNISVKDFNSAEEVLHEEHEEEKTTYTVPRRWAVRVWNVSVEAKQKEYFPLFFNFGWGGNIKEFPVDEGGGCFSKCGYGHSTIWKLGHDPQCFRTNVFTPESREPRLLDDIEFGFEWRGSYADLDTQGLSIEAWKWSRISANRRHSASIRPLKALATGPVFWEVPLEVLSTENVTAEKEISFIVRFQLYFQEMYDFVLSVNLVRAKGLLSAAALKQAQAKESSDSEGIEGDSQESANSEEDEPAGALSFRPTKAVQKSIRQSAKKGVQMSLVDQGQKTRQVRNLLAGVQVVRSDFRKSAPYRWSNVGRLHFRGTLADLDNNSMRVEFFERSGNQFSRKQLIGSALVSLRGVYDYGFLAAKLTPPEGSSASCGSFEAKVQVENLPRTRQSGDLCDMSEGRSYLLVAVNRIDRLAAPDQRPLTQCDSFVTGQFSGMLFSTTTVQDSLSPEYQQEFYFELPSSSLSAAEAAELGSIQLDVWLEGTDGCDHCGFAEVSLSEILRNGQRETRAFQSLRTGQTEQYETVVLKAKKKLQTEQPSYIFIEAWVKPLITLASAETSVKSRLESEFASRLAIWKEVTGPLSATLWPRNFPFEAPSQRRPNSPNYLSTFLDPVRPPESIANRDAVAFWIHCLPTMESNNLWFSPDFTIMTQKGDTVARALLHASLLLGCPRSKTARRQECERAFVCLGTTWEGASCAFVMTLEEDGVTLWDTVAHRKFFLPGRLADKARAERIVAGRRRVARSVNPELETAEVNRRKNMMAMEEFTEGGSHGNEPEIGGGLPQRIPEILEFFDPELHSHCLQYSSDMPLRSVCGLCKNNTQKDFLHGFVCNGRHPPDITEAVAEEGSALADDPPCEGVSFCLDCAQYAFANTAELDDSVLYTGGVFRPMMFSVSPILPWRSVEVVFNNVNVWANLQHPHPGVVYYDLWNPLYWHPFATNSSELKSFFSAARGLKRAQTDEWYEELQTQANTIMSNAVVFARRDLNASTNLQRDPIMLEFLEAGLRMRAEIELQPTAKRNTELCAEWRRAMYSKIPVGCRFIGKTLLFNHLKPESVQSQLLTACPFVLSKELGAQLCVAVHCAKLPNALTAVWVYVGMLYSLAKVDADIWIKEKVAFAVEGEPLDLLVDELIQEKREREGMPGTFVSFDMRDALDTPASDVVKPTGQLKKGSIKRQSVRGSLRPSVNRSDKYEGQVSDYVKSLTDGGTKYVSKVIKTRELQERFHVLHHISGEEIVIPSPAEMRELQALGEHGLQRVAVSRIVKREIVMNSDKSTSRYMVLCFISY